MSKGSCTFEESHIDSLTMILNNVIEERALKISDIKKLKKGEKIKVILLDRNIGDYISSEKKGKKISTIKYLKEFHLAEYIQNEDYGLTGKLIHTLGGTEGGCYDNWTWEINIRKWDKDMYWGPIDCLGKNKKIPENTKVGWRGPSILLEDLKYMPKYFKHYDICADDYFPKRNYDLTKFKTTNSLTER